PKVASCPVVSYPVVSGDELVQVLEKIEKLESYILAMSSKLDKLGFSNVSSNNNIHSDMDVGHSSPPVQLEESSAQEHIPQEHISQIHSQTSERLPSRLPSVVTSPSSSSSPSSRLPSVVSSSSVVSSDLPSVVTSDQEE